MTSIAATDIESEATAGKGAGASTLDSGGASDLRAADELLGARLLSASPDCIKLIELDGRVRLINETGMKLMEFDEGKGPVGNYLTASFPEEVRGLASDAVKDAASGKVARFSAFRPTAHGTPKWWDIVISPVHDNSGNIVCLMSVSRDITRQKAIEESLRVEEQRFRALADNMAQLAWMADSSGRLFWYNQRWFDYTGTKFEDVEGDGWKCAHHPDHLPRVIDKYRACIESGEVWEDTFPLRGADGSYRWFLSRSRPIRDGSNNIVLWCGTNTDITEQRNSSARLRQLARLIELSHEATIVWDMDGGILLWNRGCEELYGYSQGEAIGKSSHQLLQTVHPMSAADFDSLLKREGAWSGEILHTAKDGTKVWVDSRQEMVRVGGQPIVLETNRDITERRRADAVRNLLVAELNHRVKNTLAIVQSVASQTARNSATPQQFVSRFNGRLQALSNAHNVLTDAHWVGAGLRELVTSQLAVTVGDACRVVLNGPEVFLPPQAALQLTLMFHELATNAAKHGALSIPAGHVLVSWTVDNTERPALDLRWKEVGGPAVNPPVARGFGITLIERSGNLPHLKATLSFAPAGVECHMKADLDLGDHGELAFFNPGKHMQEFRAQPACVQPRAQPAVSESRKRVLIIEDDPVVGTEIEEILTFAGFASQRPAKLGADVIDDLARASFDAVIVDQNLTASCNKLLTEFGGRNVPLVLISSAPGFADGVKDQRPLVTRLNKPIDPLVLVQSLSSLLSTSGRRRL